MTALKQQSYYAVPLSTFPAEELPDLDYGAAWARRDEMPRDAWTAGDAAFGASPRNTTMYKQNVERLLAINKHFRTTVPPEQTHTLLYLLPLAALVHNAHGVEEFCKRIEATSAFASVEVGEKHQGWACGDCWRRRRQRCRPCLRGCMRNSCSSSECVDLSLRLTI